MNPKAWAFFAGLIFLEAIADVLAKESTLRKSLAIGVASVLFYSLANTSWLISLRLGTKLSIGAVMFGVCSGILGILIGGWYKEHISTSQWCGFGVGLVSIALLSRD